MGPFIVRLGTLAATATLAGGLALAASGTAFATGQPNQSCQAEPSSPGNAASAPGSAFNEDPGGVAGAVYAGSDGTPSQMNANSGNAVSQYDVACAQVSQH
jgi:hypothetical protein